EGIYAVQGLALDGHAQDRQPRLGGGHARQVCGAAGAGDDDLDATALGAGGVLEEEVGRAVRRDYPGLIGHLQEVQDVGGVLQGLPVRLGAHDDADQRLSGFFGCPHRRILPASSPGINRLKLYDRLWRYRNNSRAWRGGRPAAASWAASRTSRRRCWRSASGCRSRNSARAVSPSPMSRARQRSLSWNLALEALSAPWRRASRSRMGCTSSSFDSRPPMYWR